MGDPWHGRPMATFDAVSALFLTASPWLLGFRSAVAAPHVAAGLMELPVGMATEREPRD